MKVGSILDEPMRIHGVEPDPDRRNRRVAELLTICGLASEVRGSLPARDERWPAPAGGDRSRTQPEPGLHHLRRGGVRPSTCPSRPRSSTCSKTFARSFELTYLFIAHDLSVVHHLCDRIAVMYLGEDRGGWQNSDELFRQSPASVYPGAALGGANPGPERSRRKRAHQTLKGEVPSPLNPPSGCVFHPRCTLAVDGCRTSTPALRELRPGHWVACSEVS